MYRYVPNGKHIAPRVARACQNVTGLLTNSKSSNPPSRLVTSNGSTNAATGPASIASCQTSIVPSSLSATFPSHELVSDPTAWPIMACTLVTRIFEFENNPCGITLVNAENVEPAAHPLRATHRP